MRMLDRALCEIRPSSVALRSSNSFAFWHLGIASKSASLVIAAEAWIPGTTTPNSSSGIGNSTRRLALINNHTFEVGEQAEVKTLEGKFNVRCWEIRNRSVVVSFVGESQRKELFLNEK